MESIGLHEHEVEGGSAGESIFDFILLVVVFFVLLGWKLVEMTLIPLIRMVIEALTEEPI